ncbi:kinase-like domain-containing protein [Russula aff. rugulosa BPL654]|nr:kinase-like domain-containing protein [Russula aff. rugulosa BPL654]
MLLSGASVVRFANEYLERFRTKKQFVLVAMFIQQNGEATRYLLYQLENDLDQAVYYTTDVFKLGIPVGRVRFARQLYNFLSVLGAEGEVTMTPIQRLNEKITEHANKYGMKSLMTKKSKKKKDGQESGGGGAGAGVGDASATDSEDLGAHGYEVKSDVIVDNKGGTFEPFFKMPPNILTVFRRSDPSKQFIAKKVRKESNELEILKVLNNFQPRSEHIISLLDSFQVQSRTWAILPKMDTVKDYILIVPDELSEHIGQICWGLIKGLAYLHEHRIAHRDIKPDNLLVRKEDFCLKVIDFDTPLQSRTKTKRSMASTGRRVGWRPRSRLRRRCTVQSGLTDGHVGR